MGCCSSQMPLTDLRLHQIVYDESDPATHLGSGTTSDVYSGFHGPSGTPVAVKILCKTASITGKLSKSHGEDIEGARTEAAILKQLVLCEHVVTIMGFDETADRIVTVLELVGGGDMFTALEKGFTEAAIRSLMSQILGGLLACHAIHVAHRDIKPDNILLVHPTPESPIRIVDFGFAKQCRPESGGGRFDSSLGSPMYKAPEIWDRDARLSRGYTVKADIWSAGVLLFVMLSGQYPFQCEPARHDLSAREHLRQQKLLLSRAVLGGSLSFDEDVWGSVSSLARDLVTRMLVVDSSARLSAAECLQHAWFKATESCSAELVRARRNIVGFNARRKLRAALLAVRATTSSALYKPRTAAATSLPTTTPACSSAAVGAAEGSGKTAQAPSRAAGLLATVDGASASTEAAAPALPASH